MGELVPLRKQPPTTHMRCDVASSEFTQLLVCLPSLHRSNPFRRGGTCRVYIPLVYESKGYIYVVVYIHIHNNMYVSNSDAINMHLHTRGYLPHAAATWKCITVEISHKYFNTFWGFVEVKDEKWSGVGEGDGGNIVWRL